MPRRVSGRPITALEERTRRWVVRASSRPPPRAMEEIAEMEGMGRAEREVNVSRRLERKSAVLVEVC
jgi:hypothetical protein